MEVLIGKSSINEGILWYLIAIPAHIWDWNPTMSLFLCEFGNSYYFRAKGPAPQKHVQDAISAWLQKEFWDGSTCLWLSALASSHYGPTNSDVWNHLSFWWAEVSSIFFPGELYKKNPDGLVMFSKSKFAEIKTDAITIPSPQLIYIYTHIYIYRPWESAFF